MLAGLSELKAGLQRDAMTAEAHDWLREWPVTLNTIDDLAVRLVRELPAQ
jgi:hypothetical protein